MIDRLEPLPDGRDVYAATLATGDLRARILSLGATLQDVRLSDVAHSLTLGSPDPAAYLDDMLYFGSVVGPVANRISGATASIDGKTFVFEPLRGTSFSLHAGKAGISAKVWQIVDDGPDHVTLALDLADGEGGFPGARHIAATWRIIPPGTLCLDLVATTNAPTLMNLANHSYWNLDGGDAWTGHRLQVLADRYLPTTSDNLPTGEIAAVEGTAYDFRTARYLSPQDIPKLDNNFCLSDTRRALTPALRLTASGGLRMEVATTEPGIQVFDMATLGSGDAPTLHHRPYTPRAGIAIEPQFWPDAPGRANFPEIVLRPGEEWRQTSEWRFSRP